MLPKSIFFPFRFDFSSGFVKRRGERKGGKKGKNRTNNRGEKFRRVAKPGEDSREFFSSRFGKFVSAEESENFGETMLCAAQQCSPFRFQLSLEGN